MGYTKRKYFKAHDDLTKLQCDMLDEAFAQINRNIEMVEDFYDLPGQKNSRDGKCITKRLNGTNMLEIRSKDTDNYVARVVPVVSLNTNRITFALHYLRGCRHTWAEADTGGGDKACALAELAGTIIHEAAHTCLGNEKYGYLISHYYRWRFRKDKGYKVCNCSAVKKPKSWCAQDYKNKEEVQDAVVYCGTKKVGSKWYLDCPNC